MASVEDGWVQPGSTVVCTLTGTGLKDPATALDTASARRDSPTPARDAADRVLAAINDDAAP